MDGHRYADDSEPSWYTGSQYSRPSDSDVSGAHALGGASGGSPYESGVHERPSGAFRLPEQRPAAAGYPLTDPLSSTGSHALPTEAPRIPVRGPEYPTVRPTGVPEPPSAGASMTGASMTGASMTGASTTGGYRIPARSEPPVPVAEPTSLVPPVAADRFEQARAADSVYRTRRTASSFVVAIGMVVLMVPVVRLLLQATFASDPTARTIVPAVLLTLGFALTGIGLFALSGSRPVSREAWLRPPVAYLPAGLLLLLAAGLAVA